MHRGQGSFRVCAKGAWVGFIQSVNELGGMGWVHSNSE